MGDQQSLMLMNIMNRLDGRSCEVPTRTTKAGVQPRQDNGHGQTDVRKGSKSRMPKIGFTESTKQDPSDEDSKMRGSWDIRLNCEEDPQVSFLETKAAND